MAARLPHTSCRLRHLAHTGWSSSQSHTRPGNLTYTRHYRTAPCWPPPRPLLNSQLVRPSSRLTCQGATHICPCFYRARSSQPPRGPSTCVCCSSPTEDFSQHFTHVIAACEWQDRSEYTFKDSSACSMWHNGWHGTNMNRCEI